MRRERSGNTSSAGFDKLNALLGRDVFEDDLEVGEPFNDRCEVTVNEDGFPVKNVDFGIRNLAMNQQRNACLLHAIKQRIKCIEPLYP